MMNTIKTNFNLQTAKSMKTNRHSQTFNITMIKWTVVALCIAFSAWVFFARIDMILISRVSHNVFIAAVYAVALVLSPVVIFDCFMKKNKTKTVNCLIAIFGCLYLFAIALSIIFGILCAKDPAGALGGVVTMISLTASESVIKQQMMISVLLSCMPGITGMPIAILCNVEDRFNQISKLPSRETQ